MSAALAILGLVPITSDAVDIQHTTHLNASDQVLVLLLLRLE